MFMEVVRARLNDKFNLALLKTKEDVNFAQYPQYRPICMPVMTMGKMNQLVSDKYIGYEATLTGWDTNGEWSEVSIYSYLHTFDIYIEVNVVTYIYIEVNAVSIVTYTYSEVNAVKDELNDNVAGGGGGF